MSRKVKIFLGAYVNIINAQNINCLSLAKNLDKSKFDITILSLYSGPEIEIKGVNIFPGKKIDKQKKNATHINSFSNCLLNKTKKKRH